VVALWVATVPVYILFAMLVGRMLRRRRLSGDYPIVPWSPLADHEHCFHAIRPGETPEAWDEVCCLGGGVWTGAKTAVMTPGHRPTPGADGDTNTDVA